MTKRDDERHAAYLAKHGLSLVEPSTTPPGADAPASIAPAAKPDAVFDLGTPPATLRHRRAMQRVFREELARATWYRDTYGVPFEESDLSGYSYRDE
jgi:hypothetical protein